ncbi:MAG TPA: hypothetical protein VLJ39_19335, partial [Tepidisphaeraceae bacterium]|nr:hypothetical protein [Tepidisphaeraceae bacterium]
MLDFMTDISGCTIDVNWKAIESEGIRPDAPVTLSLKGVRSSAALARVLDAIGLAYTTDGPVICVSTRKDLRRVGYQARTVHRPDILAFPPTSLALWIELNPAISLSESLAAFQEKIGIPIDVKW